MTVECGDKVVSFGWAFRGAEPSEVVTMSVSDDWFTFDPFVEELGIPWCIVVPTFSHAFIKLLRKVLTSGGKIV
jgi:hypothetical protein